MRQHSVPVRRRLTAFAATVVSAVALALAPGALAAPAQAASSASDQLTPRSGLLFGGFAGRRGDASIEQSLADLESGLGRKLDLHRWYARWDETMPPSQVTDSVARGRTPVLSIEPRRTDGTTLSWAAIARGDHDERIRVHAAAIAALGVPLFVAFHHEPDFASGHGSAADYRAAFRHYVEVFRSVGVTNVAWTWILTPAAFASPPTTPTKVGADDLYPGDDVVDWAALDPYNWDGCTSGVPDRWRPMSEIAAPFRAWGVAHGKPLMLAEWGSAEDPDDPERKANWFRETMTTLASWPEVKAVSLFHAQGNCAWWVDSSGPSLRGAADAGARSAAHGRASAYLVPSTVRGPVPLAVTFDASRSTGAGSRTGGGVASWTLQHGDGTSQSGTGQPPAALTHTYAAGTFQARLTVKDAAGTTNTDRRTVLASAPPTVTGVERDRTATSLGLYTWVDPKGLAATVRIEWGTTTAYGSSSGPIAVEPVTYAKQLSVTAAGLTSGRTYHWRVTATTAAGTTVMTRVTATSGAPTLGWTSVSGRTSTAATVSAGVNPHHAASSVRLEWGRTGGSLSSRTAPVAIGAVGYDATVRFALSGLARGTSYSYRVVAQNALGTLRGPVGTFTTTSGS
jgi:hypothetical protein